MFEAQEKSFRLSAGDMFLIRPGQLSKYIADENQPWHYMGGAFFWPGSGYFIWSDGHFIRKVRKYFLSILEAESFKDAAEYFVCGKIYELISYLKIEELI